MSVKPIQHHVFSEFLPKDQVTEAKDKLSENALIVWMNNKLTERKWAYGFSSLTFLISYVFTWMQIKGY